MIQREADRRDREAARVEQRNARDYTADRSAGSETPPPKDEFSTTRSAINSIPSDVALSWAKSGAGRLIQVPKSVARATVIANALKSIMSLAGQDQYGRVQSGASLGLAAGRAAGTVNFLQGFVIGQSIVEIIKINKGASRDLERQLAAFDAAGSAGERVDRALQAQSQNLARSFHRSDAQGTPNDGLADDLKVALETRNRLESERKSSSEAAMQRAAAQRAAEIKEAERQAAESNAQLQAVLDESARRVAEIQQQQRDAARRWAEEERLQREQDQRDADGRSREFWGKFGQVLGGAIANGITAGAGGGGSGGGGGCAEDTTCESQGY